MSAGKVMQVQLNIETLVEQTNEEAKAPIKKTWRTIIACWLGKHVWRVTVDEQARVTVLQSIDADPHLGVSVQCALCPKLFRDQKSPSPQVHESLGLALIATAKITATDNELREITKMPSAGGMIH
jgi:hypothetical protein